MLSRTTSANTCQHRGVSHGLSFIMEILPKDSQEELTTSTMPGISTSIRFTATHTKEELAIEILRNVAMAEISDLKKVEHEY